ncbi:MAG: SPOR domain-containing protein [Vibrio sp.]
MKNFIKPLLVAGVLASSSLIALPSVAATAPTTAAKPAMEYIVRVVGVEQRDVARALAGDLAKKMRVGALLNSEDGTYRVFLGPVPTTEQADFLLKKVHKAGYPEANIITREKKAR